MVCVCVCVSVRAHAYVCSRLCACICMLMYVYVSKCMNMAGCVLHGYFCMFQYLWRYQHRSNSDTSVVIPCSALVLMFTMAPGVLFIIKIFIPFFRIEMNGGTFAYCDVTHSASCTLGPTVAGIAGKVTDISITFTDIRRSQIQNNPLYLACTINHQTHSQICGFL